MIRIIKLYLFIMLLGLAATSVYAAETVVLDETWKNYPEGAEPHAPWSIGGTADKTADSADDADTIMVTDGWVVLANVGTQKDNWNPSLTGKFDLRGKALKSVSFTYKGSGTQTMFYLKQGDVPLTSIVLGKSWNANGMRVNTTAGQQSVGHVYFPDEDVTVTLDNFDFINQTFSLKWSSSTGKSGKRNLLKMSNHAAIRANSISFVENVPGNSVSSLSLKDIRVVATDDPAALTSLKNVEQLNEPVEMVGALKGGKLQQPLGTDVWRADKKGKAVIRVDKTGNIPEVRIDVSGKPGEWITLEGPAITLPARNKFALQRRCNISCDARLNGFDSIPGLAVQIRVKQGTQNGHTAYARSASPHYTWDAAVEIGKAVHHKQWDSFEGSVFIPTNATRLELVMRVRCPGEKGTLWLRNLKVEEIYTTAHLIASPADVSNNIFFADTGSMKVDFVNPQMLQKCKVQLLDEAEREVGIFEGKEKTSIIDVPLAGKGYYVIKASADYTDGKNISTETYAAVVGKPLADEVRRKSRLGTMRVHGNTKLWKRSGSNWDWGCNEIDLNMYRLNSDGSVSTPKNYQSLKGESDYNKIRSIRHLPSWLYGSESRGNGLFPPKNWKGLENLMAEFARTNPDLSWFTPFNEPNAHFRGNKEEFVKLHKTIYAGVKKGNPRMKVYGPCMYSINMEEVEKYDKMGLFDAFDGLNMHAYVNATEPEGDFIDRICGLLEFMRQTGRKNMPLYLTEFGWCSGKGDWQKVIPSLTKAQYCSRSLCLTSAQPIDGIVYFCFQIVGLNSNESYSLIRPNGLPAPAYAAYANAVKWLAPTGKNDGRWFKFSPKVHMVLFNGDQGNTGAAWCTQGNAQLRLPSIPQGIEDMMGRPVKSPTGSTLSLSPSPMFFKLPDAMGFKDMQLLPQKTLTPGGVLELPWEGAFAAEEISLDGKKAAIANSAAPGEYLVIGKSGEQWQGQPIKIIEPVKLLSLDFLPEKYGISASAKLQSHMSVPAQVELTIKLDNGNEAKTAAHLAVQGKGAVEVALPGFAFGKRMRGTLELNLSGNVPWKTEKTFDQTLMSCPFIEGGDISLKNIEAVDFSKWGPWPRKIPAQDCSATLRTAVSQDGFRLRVEAQDNEHRQNQSASGMWQEDSLQVAFDVDADKEWQPNNVGNGYNGHRIFEYGIALPSKSKMPTVWRFRADAPDFKSNRSEERVKANVQREGSKTVYDVYFPWEVLGLKKAPKSGSCIGFALALNDRDEAGGRHVLRLFGGIVEGKNPESFGKLLISTPANK